MLSDERLKLMMWVTRCDAIAGSASYQVNGYPAGQVEVLKRTLQAAAANGVDWRKIYTSLYREWHTRRPLFPDVETMALEIEKDAEASSSPPKSA